MTQSVFSGNAADPILAELIEEITDKLHKGEAVDLEAHIQQHAERAEELRKLLPALQMLAVAGSADAAAQGEDQETSVTGVLGDFRIIREIGRGGMGVVYEAEQISLARRVALKVLPFAATMDPRQLQRFQNEARAVAQLHHTNIVPVYYVSCERGVHFYAMQYIDGHSLARVIADLRLPPSPKIADSRLQIADLKDAAKSPQTSEPARESLGSQSEICNLQSAIPPNSPYSRQSRPKMRATFVRSLSSASRRRRRSTMPTRWASSTGTSSRPTCWWTRPAAYGSPISAWPALRTPAVTPAVA